MAGATFSWVRRALVFVALLAATASVLPAAAAGRAGKLVERAEESFHRGELKRAAKLYAKADRASRGSSLPAARGVARTSLLLLRFDESVTAAERWRDLSEAPGERAVAEHFLGIALHWRGLTQRWNAAARRPAEDEPWAAVEGSTAGNESLRAAAEAYRRSLGQIADGRAGRATVLLGLAEVLIWLGEREDAAAALDRYSAAGGADPLAEDLRCLAKARKKKAEADREDSAGKEPADVNEVERPVKLHAPAPRYPPTARMTRLEGQIVLQAVVTKEGDVTCLRPLQGAPIPLAYAAMDTVRTWRFEPARLRGEPVDVYYNLTVNFKLR